MGYPMTSFARGGGLWVNHIQGGGAIAAYELVYLDAAGQWQAADADAVATMPVVGLAVEPLSVGQYGRVLLQGFATNNVWTWNPGAALYPTSATGALSETPGVLSQVVAFAHSATSIYFDPKLSGIALSLMDYEVQTGIIAEPTIVSRGNGHLVVVHNETEERDFVWARTDLDMKWAGCEFL